MHGHTLTDRTAFIRFTPEQVAVIERVGHRRQAAKAKRLERKRAERDGADLHVMGFAAEAALATLLGAVPDTRIMPKGTEGVALRAHGWAWSTKWIREPWYDLRYVAGEVPDVNAMVLCRGTLPTLELVGWTTRETFLRGYTPTDFGKGAAWVFKQASLLPMPTLFETDVLRGVAVPASVLEMHAAVRAEREAAAETRRAAKQQHAPTLFD